MYLCKGFVLCLALTACASALPAPQAASFGVTPLITADASWRLDTPSPAPTAEWTVAPPAPLLPTPARYVVQPGDTLLGIALQHGVSMAAIQLANGLGDSTLVRAGQALVIPAPLAEGESPYWIVHVVRPGESLLHLARAYGVTLESILRVNAVANPELIRAGQELIIPLRALAVAPPPTSTAALATARPPLPAIPSALPTAAPASRTPLYAPTPLPDVSGWAVQVIELVNRKRAAHNLPPLTAAVELMRSAQAHAQDCAQRGWCSHVGSDGASTLTRIQRAGYPATAWGENWVQALDPVQAVNWWYNETPPNDPHRRNLLSARYSEIGAGIAPAEYGYYFVVDLGRR